MSLTLAELAAFNTVLLAALLSPGAAMLFITRATVTGGRAAGVATGIGLGTAAALWTLAALLGLEAVFALFPWTYTALKAGGAAYLMWIAFRTWRDAAAPLACAPVRRGRSMLSGMLVNLGNPKSMLFAAAVIVIVFPQGLAATDIAVIVLNHLALELIFYTGLALALGTPHVRRGYARLKPVFDRIAATVLGALGLRLILEK